METIILHSDLNSFYASVACLHNPGIRDKPVAVCGSTEERHGIVLAANPNAKRYGVKTGLVTWQALQLCRDLVIVPPDYDSYVRFSKAARDIYSNYSPCVEPFGLDENWISLTGYAKDIRQGEQMADEIRNRVQSELGITVSIGVSYNKVFAKLGSDMRKPNFTTVISKENYKEKVWPLPASDLLYVGPKTTQKLKSRGICTIGELAQASDEYLQKLLGKNGIMLWRYANGLDRTPVSEQGYHPEEKSIGNSTTAPKDLTTETDIKLTTMLLAESVSERMREKHYKCRVVQISMRYSSLFGLERQQKVDFPIRTARSLGEIAHQLILKNWNGSPLRSIGVRACNLVVDTFEQGSLFPELQLEQRQENLEIAMHAIRNRFGHFALQRGLMHTDTRLSNLDSRDPASAQSIAFFR